MKKNYRKNYQQQYRNDRPNPATVTVKLLADGQETGEDPDHPERGE